MTDLQSDFIADPYLDSRDVRMSSLFGTKNPRKSFSVVNTYFIKRNRNKKPDPKFCITADPDLY
jgi:hypothetical protein